jgi:hypothetical protein
MRQGHLPSNPACCCINNMMQWLDRFCGYETFGAKITKNGVMVKNI